MTTTRTYPARPSTPASNVVSHTGKVVHRGRWVKAPHLLNTDRYPDHATPGWIETQACGNAHRQVAYGFPVDRPVTCKRCGVEVVTDADTAKLAPVAPAMTEYARGYQDAMANVFGAILTGELDGALEWIGNNADGLADAVAAYRASYLAAK